MTSTFMPSVLRIMFSVSGEISAAPHQGFGVWGVGGVGGGETGLHAWSADLKRGDLLWEPRPVVH